jgi:hypothetical protein
LIAGAFVALSVVLGIYVNSNFLWFTLFVGVNLFQSAFTNWCPMMTILRKLGVPDRRPTADEAVRARLAAARIIGHDQFVRAGRSGRCGRAGRRT